tara:strand:- start:77 stop:379 length:303 start_codon:yes stop_codon:yes gene_type:complete
LKEQNNLPPEAAIHFNPDCLYTLQQTPFFPLKGDISQTYKIVQLPYKYADNCISIVTWTEVLEELKEDQTIISYKFLPEQLPTSILVEYPSSSSCSASIG